METPKKNTAWCRGSYFNSRNVHFDARAKGSNDATVQRGHHHQRYDQQDQRHIYLISKMNHSVVFWSAIQPIPVVRPQLVHEQHKHIGHDGDEPHEPNNQHCVWAEIRVTGNFIKEMLKFKEKDRQKVKK